jgi:hypothetical protein
MICEIYVWHESFFWIWSFIALSTAVMIILMSGAVFYKLYFNPVFEIWQHKTNPRYPSPVAVRNEIVTSLKGLGAAALFPSLSIHLAKSGHSKAYCGVGEHGFAYLLATFGLVVVVSDFFEVSNSSAIICRPSIISNGFFCLVFLSSYGTQVQVFLAASQGSSCFLQSVAFRCDCRWNSRSVCAIVAIADFPPRHAYKHGRLVFDVCSVFLRLRRVFALWSRAGMARCAPSNRQHKLSALFASFALCDRD